MHSKRQGFKRLMCLTDREGGLRLLQANLMMETESERNRQRQGLYGETEELKKGKQKSAIYQAGKIGPFTSTFRLLLSLSFH